MACVLNVTTRYRATRPVGPYDLLFDNY